MPYWPAVSAAWRKMGFEPVLAWVDQSSDVGTWRGQFMGEIVHVPPVDGIPICNQAKVARLWLAGEYPDDICIVNDIDLLPLSRSYVLDLMSPLTNQIMPAEHMVCVGAEIYKGTADEGKFPMAYFAGYGSLFRRLTGYRFSTFVKRLVGLKEFDHKEDITNTLPPGHADCFSDESALRVLLKRAQMPVQHKPRGWDPYTERAIDRASWSWDPQQLKEGRYLEAHCPHPFDAEKIRPLLDYLGIR